ncbi:chemotaxis protein CheW [soil metagenome]
MVIETEKDDQQKFLIFQMGAEFFGTPLIDVRQVIEFHQAKPIPQMPPYFKGVINIRGEIIGVVDLRERLSLKVTEPGLSQLVFDTDSGPLAATVDRVQSVTVIEASQIDLRTASAQTADRSYFLGVAKVGDRIVTIMDLRRLFVGTSTPATT